MEHFYKHIHKMWKLDLGNGISPASLQGGDFPASLRFCGAEDLSNYFTGKITKLN